MEAFHVQVLVVTVKLLVDLRYCKVYIDKHPENVIAFKLNGFTIHVLFQSASVDTQTHMHHTPTHHMNHTHTLVDEALPTEKKSSGGSNMYCRLA